MKKKGKVRKLKVSKSQPRQILRVDLTGQRIGISPQARLNLSKALETLEWKEGDASFLASIAISAVCTEIVNLNGLPHDGGVGKKISIGSTLCCTLREKTPEENELDWLLIRSATHPGGDEDRVPA